MAGFTTACLSFEKMRRKWRPSRDEIMGGFGMKRHRRQQSGQVLVLAAISMVVLVGFLALSVDVGLLWASRRQMQTAADAAAVAAAVALRSGHSYHVAAQNTSSLNGFTDGQNGVTVTPNNPPQSGTYAGNSSYVEVVVKQPHSVYFLGVLGYRTIDVSARAVGSRMNGPACVYALNPSTSDAISVSGSSSLSLSCGVLVDSSSASALSSNGGATITAPSIGVVGGTSGGGFYPTPVTGIAPAPDPLSGLSPPTVGACDHTNYKVGKQDTATLSPGVYCGGIDIGAGAVVTLNAGTYILNGGGLSVGAGAVVSGAGVTFYNTYDGTHAFAKIDITGNPTMNVSAPTSGAYEGILFFQDRNITGSDNAHTSIITGSAQSTFDGAIYFPGTPVQYAGNSSSNGYTIVVADQISLVGNTSIKSNYSSLANGSPIKFSGLYE